MKLELASAPLRREHAAATRRLVSALIERLTGIRSAPGVTHTPRNPS
jgi:hypothetical protein